MSTTEKKKMLRDRYLKPKTKLRQERRKLEYSTAYMAEVCGLQRRQYELKEAGEYPFNDYEMLLVAKELNSTVEDIFFES